jgi:hypothetical protein
MSSNRKPGRPQGSGVRPKEDLFWEKVKKGPGCWEWIAGMRGGYGAFKSDNKKVVGAHCFSYELAFGPIPKGLCVCHSCDNRRCVRPSHFFLGTYDDNNQDMRRKGRSHGYRRYGEDNHSAKLTEQQVREIRRLSAKRCSQKHLAEQFGVSKSLIYYIQKNLIWESVSPCDAALLQRPGRPRKNP